MKENTQTRPKGAWTLVVVGLVALTYPVVVNVASVAFHTVVPEVVRNVLNLI